VALSNGDGTFGPVRFVLPDFGVDQGWRIDRHPRLLVDLTGDGRADIVGFGDAGVYVALNNGDGTFRFTPVPVINDFGFSAGGWRVDRHPRLVGVLSSSHHADIVGFGDAGVIVARGNGNGTFQAPQLMLEDFGFNQGWRVDKHPRFLADVTGEGRADIVGFGDAGVYVARTRGNGTFQFTPVPVLEDFGFSQGWRVDKHPRFLADVTGEGRADIVGFGDAGVYVARSNANGTFAFTPVPEVADFGFEAGGWRVDRNPRFLADLTGDGRADIIGFGNAGVYVSLAGRTAFGPIRFVLPNFGFLPTILALVTTDREAQEAGVWRSSDGGGPGRACTPSPGRPASSCGRRDRRTSSTPPGAARWPSAPTPAPRSPTSCRCPVEVSRRSTTSRSPRCRPAASRRRRSTPSPTGSSSSRSTPERPGPGDTGPVPGTIGGAVGLANAPNERVMVVSPRSPLEVFATGNANLVPPELWRGDYSQFQATGASQWQAVPVPNVGGQDSGNTFVAATRPGHGDVLFYGPQRVKAFVGPLDIASAADWHELDGDHDVHVDLHGIFLSPDFRATFSDGSYRHLAGTVWLASDGGIFRSTDGRQGVPSAGSISTLSVVNIAGVAQPGPGRSSRSTRRQRRLRHQRRRTAVEPHELRRRRQRHLLVRCAPSTVDARVHPRRDANGAIVGSGLGQTVSVYETGVGKLPGRRHRQRPAGGSGSLAASGVDVVERVQLLRQPRVPADRAQPARRRPGQPGDYVFIRFFGNFNGDGLSFPNNLAVLLRTRRLRDDHQPRGLDTRAGGGSTSTSACSPTSRVTVTPTSWGSAWPGCGRRGPDPAAPRRSAFRAGRLGVESGWRVDKHVRLLADLTGDGKADIVAFGDAGVYAAYSNGDGSFRVHAGAGGQRLRLRPGLAGRPARPPGGRRHAGRPGRHHRVRQPRRVPGPNNGNGTFQAAQFVLADLGFDQGWGRQARTADGRPDG
jgi:hypothetical protein